MQSKFRYIPHTAEVAFIAYGTSFSKAVENAAAAMLNTMLDLNKIERLHTATRELKITASGSNREDLVWHTLQKILTAVDSKALNAFKFKVNSIEEENGKHRLAGILFYNVSGVDFSLLEVKGVTPHMLYVKRRDKKWRIRVVVDV